MEELRPKNPEEDKDSDFEAKDHHSPAVAKKDKKKRKHKKHSRDLDMSEEEIKKLLMMDEGKLQKQLMHLQAGESISPSSVVGDRQG
jgi:hypothetical protein